MTGKAWDFVHNLASDAKWTPGLREIFEYRDLGIKDGTHGRFRRPSDPPQRQEDEGRGAAVARARLHVPVRLRASTAGPPSSTRARASAPSAKATPSCRRRASSIARSPAPRISRCWRSSPRPTSRRVSWKHRRRRRRSSESLALPLRSRKPRPGPGGRGAGYPGSFPCIVCLGLAARSHRHAKLARLGLAQMSGGEDPGLGAPYSLDLRSSRALRPGMQVEGRWRRRRPVSPGSSVQLAPELADRWIPGTSPGMTPVKTGW